MTHTLASSGLIIYKNLGVNVYLFCYLDFHGFFSSKDFFLREFLSQKWMLWLPFTTDPSDSLSILLQCEAASFFLSYKFWLIHSLWGICWTSECHSLLDLAHKQG